MHIYTIICTRLLLIENYIQRISTSISILSIISCYGYRFCFTWCLSKSLMSTWFTSIVCSMTPNIFMPTLLNNSDTIFISTFLNPPLTRFCSKFSSFNTFKCATFFPVNIKSIIKSIICYRITHTTKVDVAFLFKDFTTTTFN